MVEGASAAGRVEDTETVLVVAPMGFAEEESLPQAVKITGTTAKSTILPMRQCTSFWFMIISQRTIMGNEIFVEVA
jgi:hypothetical protein